MILEFDQETHTYKVDGVIKPSPNQIFQAIRLVKPFDQLPEPQRTYTELAGKRGSAVHVYIKLLEEGTASEYSSPSAQIIPYISAWINFKIDYDVTLSELEKPSYGILDDICGTPDSIGLVRNVKTVIDIKTAKTVSDTSRMQTMAYWRFDETIEHRLIVQLKDDGSYKLLDNGKFQDVKKNKKPFMNDKKDLEDWLACLRVYRLGDHELS